LSVPREGQEGIPWENKLINNIYYDK